jgi:hypothetical protein
VVLDDRKVGLLYECGSDDGILYVSFSLDWLSGGNDCLEKLELTMP